jgi:hypothetical protein
VLAPSVLLLPVSVYSPLAYSLCTRCWHTRWSCHTISAGPRCCHRVQVVFLAGSMARAKYVALETLLRAQNVPATRRS